MKQVSKVRYIGANNDQVKWGSCADPRPVLTEGGIYTIEQIEVHNWHTKFFLDGQHGGFPSVAFEALEEASE